MYDLAIIGGGPGGYVCAIRAAQNGLSVVCIERKKTLGGTCLNEGCIPSKALLESSHHYHLAKHDFSIHGIDCNPKIDVSKMLARKDSVVSNLTKGIDMLFKKNKITRIEGTAKIISKNTIQVGSDKIEAKNIVIATGSVNATIPTVSIDEKYIVSSTGALCLEKVPEKMVVIGGGYIGLELGSVWSRLGSEVTVVEFADRIVPAMDKEVSSNFHKILEKQGIKIMTSTKVLGAKVVKGKVENEVESNGVKSVITSDITLLSIGRKPYTDGLFDENFIKKDSRGMIEINDNFQTNISNIYAIGDVVRGPMLAHKAEEEGVAVADLIAGKSAHINYDTIPGIVYTHPEVATIGFTEENLKEKGVEYNVGKFNFAANSRAIATNDTQGFVKILACKKTDRVLGCHIIGREAGNMIHEVAVLMEFKGSAEDLSMICHGHPTLNEAVKEAALAVHKRTINS
jgi:dihydrolipoamide dehydrogenase